MASSFQIYAGKPSAIISEGLVTVPLYAVTTLSLSETYQLPPIGSSGLKAAVAVHDDTISLSGSLIGDERFAWKLGFENLAYAPAGQGEQRVGVSRTAELYGAPLDRERTAALETAVPGQGPQPAVDRVKTPGSDLRGAHATLGARALTSRRSVDGQAAGDPDRTDHGSSAQARLGVGGPRADPGDRQPNHGLAGSPARHHHHGVGYSPAGPPRRRDAGRSMRVRPGTPEDPAGAMMTSSFAPYLHTPSALLFDGIVPVPLWAVTQMSIDASYSVPAVGGSNLRVALPTHDDTIALSAVLIGPLRLEWKTALENIAEASRYGTVLSPKTGGLGTGLVLVSSATVRTNLAVQSLSFSLSAARRDTIDVNLRLIHLPPPGSLTKLLDTTSIAVGALTDALPF